MRQLPVLIPVLLIAFGCASPRTTTAPAGTGKYTEDLSVWRPEIQKPVDSVKTAVPQRTRKNQYVAAKYAVNEEVDVILDSIYQQNLSRGFVDGYTIQVYSGTKREDALNIKKKLGQSLPDIESDVQYKQPNFRVLTGKYLTRLEAQQDYLSVKRYFPNAIVIPDKISIE
ncbi:MAG TPA: SPOR domain-containing protein [Chryseosolibacter sp.]